MAHRSEAEHGDRARAGDPNEQARAPDREPDIAQCGCPLGRQGVRTRRPAARVARGSGLSKRPMPPARAGGIAFCVPHLAPPASDRHLRVARTHAHVSRAAQRDAGSTGPAGSLTLKGVLAWVLGDGGLGGLEAHLKGGARAVIAHATCRRSHRETVQSDEGPPTLATHPCTRAHQRCQDKQDSAAGGATAPGRRASCSSASQAWPARS